MSKDKPNNPIAYRPPKDKRAQIDAMIKESGLSYSAFITDCILKPRRYRPAETRKLAQLLATAAEIADCQRDHRFAETPETRQLQELILRELGMIRTAIMSRLGRRS